MEALIGAGGQGKNKTACPHKGTHVSMHVPLSGALCSCVPPEALGLSKAQCADLKMESRDSFFVVPELHTQSCAGTRGGANGLCVLLHPREAGGWVWWAFVFRGTEATAELRRAQFIDTRGPPDLSDRGGKRPVPSSTCMQRDD